MSDTTDKIDAPPKRLASGDLLGTFKAYEGGRVYLDVITRPTPDGWLATCNRKRVKMRGKNKADHAAMAVAVRAFSEYFDREVSSEEIRLESETIWECVASVKDDDRA